LRDRKRMFYEGAAVVSVLLDEDNNVTSPPQIAVLGIADPLENARENNWDFVITTAINRLPKKSRRDDTVVEESVRGAVRKVFSPARKPVVKVHVFRM